MVELLVVLEEKFNVAFDDTELFIGEYPTLNDLYIVLTKKVRYGKKD